jgi:hypothetical protein
MEEATEKLKTNSGSPPNYDLSNHTTYSQTKTSAGVPLSLYFLRKSCKMGEIKKHEHGPHVCENIFNKYICKDLLNVKNTDIFTLSLTEIVQKY